MLYNVFTNKLVTGLEWELLAPGYGLLVVSEAFTRENLKKHRQNIVFD